MLGPTLLLVWDSDLWCHCCSAKTYLSKQSNCVTQAGLLRSKMGKMYKIYYYINEKHSFSVMKIGHFKLIEYNVR